MKTELPAGSSVFLFVGAGYGSVWYLGLSA